MDERELHCPKEHPLIAWRLFRARRSEEGGFVLSAPLIHDPGFEQFPSQRIEAVCYDGEHPAPEPGCRCGLYAAIDGTLDSLSGYLRDSAHDQDPAVYAEVACIGRVFLDARGVRAERIEILRLAIFDADWPDAGEREELVGQLSARYRVDVHGSDVVPSWIHLNDAPRGAPPQEDEASVDLDQLITAMGRTTRTQREGEG